MWVLLPRWICWSRIEQHKNDNSSSQKFLCKSTTLYQMFIFLFCFFLINYTFVLIILYMAPLLLHFYSYSVSINLKIPHLKNSHVNQLLHVSPFFFFLSLPSPYAIFTNHFKYSYDLKTIACINKLKKVKRIEKKILFTLI